MPRVSRPPKLPEEVTAILDAIGNGARTEILHRLSTSSMTTAELADEIGVDHSRVLRHLAVLEDAGLVSADHPRGARRGVGRVVKWTANRERVKEIGRIWTDYVTGQSSPTDTDTDTDTAGE